MPKLLQPKTLYKVVKELARRTASVRKPGGTMASTHAELQRWRLYFESVLNCPEQVIIGEFSSEDAIQLDINTGPITRDEVSKAISNLKNSKTAGIDGIRAE